MLVTLKKEIYYILKSLMLLFFSFTSKKKFIKPIITT